MNKGCVRKGKWQRAIVAELGDRRAFYVRDLLPSGYSRAQYVALLRAVCLLEERGLVQVCRYMTWGNDGAKVAVSLPGVEFERKELRANVDKVPIWNLVNIEG